MHERGYVEGSCDFIFHKTFTDCFGKKYEISIEKYLRADDAYEYESYCELYKSGSHAKVELNFSCDWGIVDVEEFVEDLFQEGKLDYYERNDEK